MKTFIWYFVLTLFCANALAQNAGDIVYQNRAIEAIGDTAYYLNDTIQIQNANGDVDTQTKREFLGDSTQTAQALGSFVFPDLADASSGISTAFGLRESFQKIAIVNPLIQQLTGFNFFQYAASRFGNRLTGNWIVAQDDGTRFNATVSIAPNGTLRLTRESDSAQWVIQVYVPNMFRIVNFDHDNDPETPEETHLFNFYRSDDARVIYFPLGRLSGDTTRLALVKRR